MPGQYSGITSACPDAFLFWFETVTPVATAAATVATPTAALTMIETLVVVAAAAPAPAPAATELAAFCDAAIAICWRT